jgi:hypothetical protein
LFGNAEMIIQGSESINSESIQANANKSKLDALWTLSRQKCLYQNIFTEIPAASSLSHRRTKKQTITRAATWGFAGSPPAKLWGSRLLAEMYADVRRLRFKDDRGLTRS